MLSPLPLGCVWFSQWSGLPVKCYLVARLLGHTLCHWFWFSLEWKLTIRVQSPVVLLHWWSPSQTHNLWSVYQVVKLPLPVSAGVSCWVIQAKLWKMHWKNQTMWFWWFCPLCPLIRSRNDLAILCSLIQVIGFVSYFFTVLHKEKGMCLVG